MSKKVVRLISLFLISFMIFLLMTQFALSDLSQETQKIKRAYNWLSGNTLGKWSSLNMQEQVFSMLALRDKMTAGQINTAKRLLIDKSRNQEAECWPQTCKTLDTAFAKLALNNIGENTQTTDDWLLSKTTVPSLNIDWYLQIITSGSEPVLCELKYDNSVYTITINTDETISGNSGSCFSNANYWLKLDSQCSDKTFNLFCNNSISTNFLFKKSNEWYISFGLESAGEQEDLEISITSLCITESGSCNYEATAWTAYAFMTAGQSEEAQMFLPYLASESNSDEAEKILGQALMYGLTKKQSYQDYLQLNQQEDGLWIALNTKYNKYHDTGLVALSSKGHGLIGDSEKTRETLLSEQKTQGYWECLGAGCSKIRDTALILYSIWPSLALKSACEQQGYTCIGNCSEANGVSQSYSCDSGECCQISFSCEDKYGTCKASCDDNEAQVDYQCSTGGACCKPYQNSMCVNEIGGEICSYGQECIQNNQIIPFIQSSDNSYCCLGTCETASSTCSELGGTLCNNCPAGGELNSIDAVGGLLCCAADYCSDSACNVMGGEICLSDESCLNGQMVSSTDSDSCCMQGGTCVPQSCNSINGVSCEADETCSGQLQQTEDTLRCCIGACLKSCSDLGGTICSEALELECDGMEVEASDISSCCIGECKEKSGFPWIILIIFVILFLGAGMFFLIKTKKIKIRGIGRHKKQKSKFDFGFKQPQPLPSIKRPGTKLKIPKAPVPMPPKIPKPPKAKLKSKQETTATATKIKRMKYIKPLPEMKVLPPQKKKKSKKEVLEELREISK